MSWTRIAAIPKRDIKRAIDSKESFYINYKPDGTVHVAVVTK